MARHWLTGEPFGNIFGVSVELNDGDDDHPTDLNKTCGKLSPTGNPQLLYESCNIREKLQFLCEIVLS